jgi:type II secretory ATPase GspE/PulE/Tfp pilus assembly ATPase PilB-like protein
MPDLILQPELDRFCAAGVESVPALVDWLLAQAAARGASDLHLEPRSDAILLRWRLDGCLADAGLIRGECRHNAVQRLKVLGGLLTYRTDIPQDGRIAGQNHSGVDMRLSIYPAVLGEKAVVRFFQKHAEKNSAPDAAVERDFVALGLDAVFARKLEALLARPQGLLLLTGPAGSGKTTTLYAALRHIVGHSCGRSSCEPCQPSWRGKFRWKNLWPVWALNKAGLKTQNWRAKALLSSPAGFRCKKLFAL